MEITPETPEWGLRVATAVHGVFSERYPATRGQGLQASCWAPKQALSTPMGTSASGPSGSGGQGKGLAASRWAPREVAAAPPSPPSPTPSVSSYHSASSSIASYYSAHSYLSAFSTQYSPSPHQSPQLNSSLTSTRSSSRPSSNEVSKMYQVANLDDTSGFMAAARALAQQKQANPSSKDKDASGTAKGESKSPRRSLSPSAPEFVPSSSSPVVENSPTQQKKNESTASSNFNPNAEAFVPSGANLAKEEIVNSAKGAGLDESDAKKVTASSNEIVNSAQGAGLDEFDAKKDVTSSSNKIVNFAQGAGLDESVMKNKATAPEIKLSKVDDTSGFMAAARARMHGSDAKKEVTVSSNESVKSTQGAGLDESVAKNKATAPEVKTTNVDDTTGFMAAARARMHGSDAKKEVTASSNGSVKSGTQDSGLVGSDANKVAASSNEIVKSTQDTGLVDSAKNKAPASEIKMTTDVDDTAGFMAAARAWKSRNMSPVYTHAVVKTPDQLSEHKVQNHSSPVKEHFKSSTKVEKASSGNATAGLGGARGSKEADAKKEAITDAAAAGKALNTDSAKHSNPDNGAEAKQTGFSASSENSKHSQRNETFIADIRPPEDRHETVTYVCRDVYEPIPGKKGAMRHVNQLEVVDNIDDEEDRENLIIFKTWGTPAPRNKPPAQVRRIILTGLPPAWANPSKALSLVHTGVIDKINMSPAGNAHICFCDHKACKAFFDKHPNGIGIGSHNVYVERGKEVDVVSSQLALNRSLGATRVLRAAGVDMDTTMTQLHQIASGQNRKVEKIVDSYIPGEARIVQFRFCSIEDAVRFRSKLIRDEAWETCNIQYGKDPCEVDAGSHID